MLINWHLFSRTAINPRTSPVPIEELPIRRSPILTETICAPGARPFNSGFSG